MADDGSLRTLEEAALNDIDNNMHTCIKLQTCRAAAHRQSCWCEPREDIAIRNLAVRLAQENDVSVDRAENAIRNLIARGLIGSSVSGKA